MSRFIRSAFFPILIVIILAIIVQVVIRGNNPSATAYTYQGGGNSFVSQLDQGKVQSVVINTKDQTVQVTTTNGQKYSVNYPDTTQLTQLLAKYPTVTVVSKSPSSPWWTSALTFILPFVLIIGFWIFIMNQMQGGGSRVMSFGKSRAKRVSVDSPKVTFKDVAGRR